MRLLKSTGILLINLGTPNDPSVASVRKYLKQFLSDPRVVELPFILRWLLLRLIILPRRAINSAKAYASIWESNGSPLLLNSITMSAALQQALGASYKVAVGMRYGNPSIADALVELQTADINHLIVLPLFPQYSSAANGSAIEQTLKILAKYKVIMPLTVISDFFADEHYVEALSSSIEPYLASEYDFLLMSYHGLPEKQLINPGISCYRTKCLHTSQLVADYLSLPAAKWGVSFQSRLGRIPWIKPYTDHMLNELRQRGIKKLLVTCPSFVADCLETLEEIGLRAREQWLKMGGESLQLIPCLNAQERWINALQAIISKNSACR